jgi:hypothetical protein
LIPFVIAPESWAGNGSCGDWKKTIGNIEVAEVIWYSSAITKNEAAKDEEFRL